MYSWPFSFCAFVNDRLPAFKNFIALLGSSHLFSVLFIPQARPLDGVIQKVIAMIGMQPKDRYRL